MPHNKAKKKNKTAKQYFLCHKNENSTARSQTSNNNLYYKQAQAQAQLS